jgi:hypothetical protein
MLLALSGFAAGPTQGPELNRIMREKLDHSQKILEAVVTSNWVELETHSRELERLTDDPRWMVLNAPEYARHSIAFKQAARTLHEAAARRELEAAPLAYVSLTMSCVQCHRYLARERIAR